MNRPIGTRGTRRWRALVVVVGLAVLGPAGVAFDAVAAPAPPAQLSITLTDGLAQVHSNTGVSYITKVTNQGSSAVTAKLVLATPSYVTITHAAGAKVAAHSATWRITVRPGHTITRPAKAHIGTIAKGEYRVTALASLYRGKTTSGVPLIRTAVANAIAGVTDPAHTIKGTPTRPARTHDAGGTNWLLVAGVPAVAVVLVAAGAWVWWRRRRPDGKRGASPARPGAGPTGESVTPPAAEPAMAPEESSAHREGSQPMPAATGRHHADDSD